jgi:hypothetical protein
LYWNLGASRVEREDGTEVSVGGGGGSSYPEVANFAALPGSPDPGDTVVVLAASGIPFINRKDSGLYRYSGSAWVFLGPVPEGYFTDNVVSFFDDADVTKQLRLQLSGISSGTTRTLTAPDASGTIALTADIPAVITDHGSMSGLADDDHPQYHNDARGDARYDRRCGERGGVNP